MAPRTKKRKREEEEEEKTHDRNHTKTRRKLLLGGGSRVEGMKSARRAKVPLSKECRKDQGCVSPPTPYLEPDSSQSNPYGSQRTPFTGRKLDVHVEPEYCPQAVNDYLNSYQSIYAKNVKELREKAKKHLSAEGWTFSLHLKGKRRDPRYTNLYSSATFKSLVAACIRYVKEVSERMSQSSHDKFLSTIMHPEVLRICYTQPSGVSQQPKDNSEAGIVQVRSRDEHLKSQRNSYAQIIEESSMKSKVSGPQSDNECKTDHVPRSSQRVRQVVVPRSGHCNPRTILNWLIENDVVLPRAKVCYLSARDGSAIGQGKTTCNGVKCNCCKNIFGLYRFGLHVGSCYTPPSARIYLEDGRSLLDCQKQLQEKCSNIYAKKGDLVHNTNDDICSICYHGGTLLLCDQCPSSFHLNCLGLEDVPDGKWICSSCRCRICGQQSKLDSDSELLTGKEVLHCDQCNHEYHVECVRDRGLSKLDHNNQTRNWFCNISCEKIYARLHKLLGNPFAVGKDNLSWTILKSTKDVCLPFAPSEIEVAMECQSKLNVALAIMHECFEPIKDMKRDLFEDVIFNKASELNRLNFWGFYTVILERDDELVSVAAVRIHDKKLAEVPLVCTRLQYRRQGMCRILFDVLEEKLRQLEVERVILPSPQVLHSWTTSLGFSKLTNSERLEFLDYTFLDFQDTRMCQKFLRMSPVSAKTTEEVPIDVQPLAGTCTHVDALTATEESEKSTPQCVNADTDRNIIVPEESFAQLVDDLKIQGFDDSDSDDDECAISRGGDTPLTCFRKRRLYSPCEPSMKDNVVLDTDTVAEQSASGLETKRRNAALKIQKVFRGFLIRMSIQKIVVIKREVEEIERKLSENEMIKLICNNTKERLKMNEMLMRLLLRLDSIRGVDSDIRDARKSVIRKAIMLQDRVDKIAAGDLMDDAGNAGIQVLEDGKEGAECKGPSDASEDMKIDSVVDRCVEEVRNPCEANEGNLMTKSQQKSNMDSSKLSVEGENLVDSIEIKQTVNEIQQPEMIQGFQLLTEMVAELCRSNVLQAQMINSLSQRVESLEKAYSKEKLRRKKNKTENAKI